MGSDRDDRNASAGPGDSELHPNPIAEGLAGELAVRWTPALMGKSWAERLRLLHQIHEQLQEDLEDLRLYSEISPALIREIIARLSGGPITSLEQAQIYANSGDQEHRRAAGEWLAGRLQKTA